MWSRIFGRAKTITSWTTVNVRILCITLRLAAQSFIASTLDFFHVFGDAPFSVQIATLCEYFTLHTLPPATIPATCSLRLDSKLSTCQSWPRRTFKPQSDSVFSITCKLALVAHSESIFDHWIEKVEVVVVGTRKTLCGRKISNNVAGSKKISTVASD